MAQIIDGQNVNWNGRKNRYPWKEWFDGQARIMKEGEDYHCSTQGFISMVYRTAKLMGVKVRVCRRDSGEVAVQALVSDE